MRNTALCFLSLTGVPVSTVTCQAISVVTIYDRATKNSKSASVAEENLNCIGDFYSMLIDSVPNWTSFAVNKTSTTSDVAAVVSLYIELLKVQAKSKKAKKHDYTVEAANRFLFDFVDECERAVLSYCLNVCSCAGELYRLGQETSAIHDTSKDLFDSSLKNGCLKTEEISKRIGKCLCATQIKSLQNLTASKQMYRVLSSSYLYLLQGIGQLSSRLHNEKNFTLDVSVVGDVVNFVHAVNNVVKPVGNYVRCVSPSSEEGEEQRTVLHSPATLEVKGLSILCQFLMDQLLTAKAGMPL